jgi:superfamily II DNA or RNA helicase
MNDLLEQLKQDAIVEGPFFDEPVRVILTIPMGESVKLIGTGTRTRRIYEPILTAQQLAQLVVAPETEPFDGDATRFRLGIEAMRLALAYEYDRYFSLSIARVDPLPHQLEAVYDYFLRLPRIRFLLADDPGAGKTIMAGLLIKEMKIRGLVSRILIVTPANLTFQWQREMKDRFHEQFTVIGGDVLRSIYGANPWQDHNQGITSLSWVSRIDDAKESLLNSQWDLVIVDEAHKMSAYSEDKKTLAYQLGEALSHLTDHYLLMTATPHKGDPQNFCLFLRLLDADVYADISSLEEAIEQHEAPFYLRRVKEALVTFPHQETGEVRTLFTRRNVQTIPFLIDDDEWEFYDALTTYVEEQSVKAAADETARGRVLGFTMAMLQRRFASSIYAARRSLERMRERRKKILADPAAYRQEQIQRRMPDDFEEMSDEEQQELLQYLETVVVSVDPVVLREEIGQLTRLIDQALHLEQREIETKLRKLHDVLIEQGVFDDPRMKLLIFTEHKDTLDYLVDKLQAWNLTVTQIHGGMKIGDRDTLGTRIHAERAFRETAQVMVATEAAGEGINLQFCWFLINYDIPWNPVRLEQRMGRIHRYGQEKDCLIFNFVSTRTREGRVLDKLFERIRAIEYDLDPDRTGKIFNVLGDVLPSNQLERMLRDMYAHNLTDEVIINRIVEQVDTERFARITSSALEGLAKREINLSAIISKTTEAKERRLVPEVIRDFFLNAAEQLGMQPTKRTQRGQCYRINKVPRTLVQVGQELEHRFGKIGREYEQIVFDQEQVKQDPTLEWVTPGHPLFESVRESIERLARTDLQRGAVFYDLHRSDPASLLIYSAAIQDGWGHILHRRLYVLEVAQDGTVTVRQPTIFLDLTPAPKGTAVPDSSTLPTRAHLEQVLYERELVALQQEVQQEREKEIATITHHMELSLKTLIDRQNIRYAALWQQQQAGDEDTLLAANLKRTEDRLDELNARLTRRSEELQQERHCTITDIQHHGRAWVLPHPQRSEPEIAPMVRDDEIERIAVESVIAYEEQRGWQVKSVEQDNRGFDLISSLPPDVATPAQQERVRFIEVKGRSGVGDVALTTNEYRTAERLGKDYWLYVVYHCATRPAVHPIQNPARLGWEPVVKVEHYRVAAKEILEHPEKEKQCSNESI